MMNANILCDVDSLTVNDKFWIIFIANTQSNGSAEVECMLAQQDIPLEISMYPTTFGA
jgi:hypothetical protein